MDPRIADQRATADNPRMPADRAGPLSVPIRRRPTTWVALGLLALALVMLGFVWISKVMPGWEAIESRPRSLEEFATQLTQTIAFVTLASVGALLAIRRPRNPVGWILLLSGLGFSAGTFSTEYVRRSIATASYLPADRLADWLGFGLGTIAFELLVVWLPLAYPDGRLPSPRWRPVVAGAGAFSIVALMVLLLSDRERPERFLPNPIRLEGAVGAVVDVVDGFVTPFLILFVILAFSSVVARYRASRGIERQQMKWFLAAVGLLAGTVVFILLTGAPRQGPPAYLAFAFLPIAVGIAILRYRLYEIDRLISRTISWAIVTFLLVAAFAAAVLAFQAVLAGVTQAETLAVAASTLIAFALFAPVRRRVQRAVDQRFDRTRYDNQRVVTHFGERLRDQADLGEVEADIASTVRETLRPATVTLWVRSKSEGWGRGPG